MAQFTLPNAHDYFVDSAGRLLIFSCGIDGLELKDPRTLTKTTGKVLPSSNTCIDDARWQYIRNTLAPSSDDWRLAVATTDSTVNRACDTASNERSRLLTASTRNINTMRSYNVRALPSSLTDWLFRSEFSGGGSVTFCWDENSGSDGTGLDYSGIIFQSPIATPASSYRGFGIYSQSSKPIFGSNTFSYFHRNLEFWILPPGVPDFDTERPYQYSLDGGGLSHNPADPASNHQYGWFTRSGGENTNPVGGGTNPFQGDCRQLVLVWNGVVIFDSIDSPVIVAPAQGAINDFVSWAGAGTSVIGNTNYTYPVSSNCGVVVGNYVYYAGTFQGSEYGWPSSGIGYSAPLLSGDFCNGFQIRRRRYFPSTPTYTGNKSNGQTSSTPTNSTNIFFDVNGGRGGLGGAGYGNPGATSISHPGGYYAHGQRIAGYIKPSIENLTYIHYVGGNGGSSFGYPGAPGGTGGIAGGGAGFGRSGSFTAGDYYGGGGGGGGAASGIYISTLAGFAAVAGGGGSGGGGSWFDFDNIDARVVPTFTFASTVPPITSGGNSNSTPISNNGGGGGGGGGAPGGGAGSSSTAGNSISGGSGIGGSGYADADFVDYGYIIPDWQGSTYFGMGSSGASRLSVPQYHTDFVNTFGSSSTRNSNWNPNGKVELYYYTLNALTYSQEVSIRLKIFNDGVWVPVKEMYVKDGTTWKLVQDSYIKKDDIWQSFYG